MIPGGYNEKNGEYKWNEKDRYGEYSGERG